MAASLPGPVMHFDWLKIQKSSQKQLGRINRKNKKKKPKKKPNKKKETKAINFNNLLA
jgi:hypothetical protein